MICCEDKEIGFHMDVVLLLSKICLVLSLSAVMDVVTKQKKRVSSQKHVNQNVLTKFVTTIAIQIQDHNFQFFHVIHCLTLENYFL